MSKKAKASASLLDAALSGNLLALQAALAVGGDKDTKREVRVWVSALLALC
jgi:hypothetical protein